MHGMELAAPSVLIISDTEAHAAALSRQVEPLGVKTLVLPDCRAAIEEARRHDIAIVLLDLQLPMMDGLEAIRLLRTSPRTAHTPVIMIAEGRLGIAERQRGQSLGAFSYLQRQELDFDALQDQMRLLLDLHRRANALQLQIYDFLDDHARLAAENAQVRGLQAGLHRHLLQDLLTGLSNRMFFDLHLAGLVRRGARGGRPFAFAWIDIDHLKRINDRYHREVGDQVLIQVAQRLESVVRASDVLARIGGDTYGVILDGIDEPRQAQAALGKVLAVAGESLELSGVYGQPLTLIPTLSVGVALYPRHGEDQAGLLHVAEQAAAHVLGLGGDGVHIGWGDAAPAAAPGASRVRF